MLTTDSSLINRVRNLDDQAGWNEFKARYEPLIFRYVRSRGVPAQEAEEIVQEVFVRLVQHMPKFELDRSAGRFRTWLWKVTMNVMADRARQRGRDDEAKATWLERVRADAASPSEQEDAQWRLEYRKRILEFVLPLVRPEFAQKTWACFEQHLLASRPAPEVAKELGLTEGAVYTNTSRVLARVRENCLEYEEELSDEWS